MKMKTLLLIIILSLCSVRSELQVRAQALDTASQFTFTDCPFTVPKDYSIDCGYLTVPEDWTESDTSRTIKLAVAIIHSHGNVLSDPVVYLNGGPGGSSLATISEDMNPIFDAILMYRDVIFVDQRGTGYSYPSLNCPEFERLNLTTDRNLFTSALVECRDRLISDGINLAAYNSAASAADFADLRAALGYEEWNLYGVSYGTRLALTILRDYPEGVRSVILNSTMPPTASVYLEGAGNFQRSLQVLFAACQQGTMCHLAYPDLSTRFYEVLERFYDQPITINSVSIDGFTLTDMIFNGLYSPDVIVLLPAAIYTISEGDYSILKQAVGSGNSPSVDSDKVFSEGMFYSGQCSEAASLHTYAEIIASLTPYPVVIQQYWRENVLFGAEALTVCDKWLPVVPDPRDHLPIQSAIPMIVLAGEFDPVTPPRWGQEVAALNHSYFYLFPNMGHNVVGSCPTEIILSFLDNPLNEPDGHCIEQMPHPAFLIRAAFSIPFVLGAAGVLLMTMIVGSACLYPYFYRRWALTWHISQHFVGGWQRNIGLVGLITMAYAFTLPFWEASPLHLRVLELVFPFIFGLQTALIFPPDDEPALEVMLVCQRPAIFIVIERLLTLLMVQGSVIMLITLLSLSMPLAESLPLAVARWMIPSLFIGSLSLYFSIVTRRATSGSLLTIVICAVSIIGMDAILSRFPFLWFLHLYLQPADVSPQLYVLNRLLLLLTAILIFIRTLQIMGNEEYILNVK